MLALDPHYLDVSVYLYPSERDASDGTRVGGSGFVVSIPSRYPPKLYFHIVTVAHVLNGGNRFVRFNAKDRDTVIMDTNSEDWVVSPDDDLAVLSTELPAPINWVSIAAEIFLPPSCTIEGWPIFPGDEVFFCGRFIGHDGVQRNKPVVRFGSISMLADAEVPIDFGPHQQVGFLVECRSLSGFSGSPAFVRLAETRLPAPREKITAPFPRRALKFLGVDCGHLPFWSSVRTKQHQGAETITDMHVETNSGLAVVIPAWRLMSLLNDASLAEEREAIERKRAAKRQGG